MPKLSETVVHLGHAVTSADDNGVVTIIQREGNNPDEVSKIVESLPVNHIIPFLQIVDSLLREESIKDIRPWIVWLNAIFKIHATYLSSISDLNEKLGTLTEWMNSRIKNLDKLIQLQGKLEFITEQMRKTTEVTKHVDMQPVLTFEE